ncbi:unnamed protein product [Didymodactylos carnosus]|uniref:RNase H type-1 domain-containing protein n=1 Tax=Didymodactylos carnosus TaxID=1234261 RepID=A0A815KIH4_9BILA|nr:unnamed protein product [Didymodactylos carnosus]CAF1396694.1 unnamed protein product [Didymodactylos carnosus]CAF4009471.1 unnamed protein product [Didymodactylos carnosus]CAF4290876.1 unnamed protein product [Didymodactylos carnosus]
MMTNIDQNTSYSGFQTDLSACAWANVTKAALKPLMKLQKLTLTTALGTSRQTVALSSLEVFCNLLPAYFRLMRRQMIKAITLHSRLLYHPLSALFEKPETGTIFAKLKEIISTVSSDNNPMSKLIKHSEMHVLSEPCATAVDVIISNDELALNKEQELLEKIDNTTMLLIYTDASKQHDEVAAAVMIMTTAGDEFRWEDYGMCLGQKYSVYYGELLAIQLALKILVDIPSSKQITLFTDNQSTLKAIASNRQTSPLIQDIRKTYEILRKDNSMIFRWIPGHLSSGHNYLVPVVPFDDNDYSFSHYSPEYDFICLDDVLKRLNQHRNLVNIVILDACRADEQNDTWKSKDITGSLSSLPIIPVYGTSKGLSANVRTPQNSEYVLIFSSDPENSLLEGNLFHLYVALMDKLSSPPKYLAQKRRFDQFSIKSKVQIINL